jgi:hypothetical protein
VPTHRERIISHLRTHPEGADDDELSAALSIRPRATVNRICRELEREGMIRRRAEGMEWKIVNRWVSSPLPPPPEVPPPRPVEVLPPDRDQPVDMPRDPGVRMVPLSDDTVRTFVYEGTASLSEDQVKVVLKAALEKEGWKVDVRWGHVQGIDLDARRGAERLIIEAKGEGSRNPMRVNYFLGAMGELLQRMDSSEPSYAIALPAHRQFAGLVCRLPTWVRAHLKLQFFLVRPVSKGSYEVGRFLSPHL